MELIIDANVLFAGLIKDSRTYELIMHDDIILFAPEFIFDEYKKHKERLLKITKGSESDFLKQVHILERRIYQVPLQEIKPFVKKAVEITPDIGDVPYLALGLKMHIPIWSNDVDLKEKQDIIRVYSTKELNDILM